MTRIWELSLAFSVLALSTKPVFLQLASEKRVIGGQLANDGSAPWLVSLTFYQRDKFMMMCGASIIHRRFLLTAAHCFYLPGSTRLIGPNVCDGCYWKARFGSEYSGVDVTEMPGIPEEDTDWYRQQQAKTMTRFAKMEQHEMEIELRNTTKTRRPKRLGLSVDSKVYEDYITKIIPHPKYINSNLTNDIAVVVMASELPEEMLPRVEILRVPTKEMTGSLPKTREPCLFAGWGCLHSGASPTTVAYIVNMTVRSDQICEAIYKRKIDTKKQLCAGTLQAEHQGTCRGDSGGPLLCIRNRQSFQAGILSFGIQRREAYTPSVFTKLTPHIDWIHEVIRKN